MASWPKHTGLRGIPVMRGKPVSGETPAPDWTHAERKAKRRNPQARSGMRGGHWKQRWLSSPMWIKFKRVQFKRVCGWRFKMEKPSLRRKQRQWSGRFLDGKIPDEKILRDAVISYQFSIYQGGSNGDTRREERSAASGLIGGRVSVREREK